MNSLVEQLRRVVEILSAGGLLVLAGVLSLVGLGRLAQRLLLQRIFRFLTIRITRPESSHIATSEEKDGVVVTDVSFSAVTNCVAYDAYSRVAAHYEYASFFRRERLTD